MMLKMFKKSAKGRAQRVWVFNFKERRSYFTRAQSIEDGICVLRDKVMAVSDYSYVIDGETGERIAVVDENTVAPLDLRKLPNVGYMPFSHKDLYNMNLKLRRREADKFINAIGKRPFNRKIIWASIPLVLATVSFIALVIYDLAKSA